MEETLSNSRFLSNSPLWGKKKNADERIFHADEEKNAGSKILEYDSRTTPDFGLTVLAKYFFNIDIPPEKYIGPGKPNTKITIPPNIVPPHSFGIAQQSNRYVWGPWIGGSLKGKSEVITDDSLVPESFGSADGMNQAGEALAKVGNAEMAASETGYIEIAEFPAYNIAERFADIIYLFFLFLFFIHGKHSLSN